MTAPLAEQEDAATDKLADSGESRLARLRWWARAVEVRLRSVLLVVLVVILVTQWKRLRQTWDACWYAWSKPFVASGVVSGDTEFFCPMDPGVVSIWPAVCPICSMDLVVRKKHEAQLLPEGVIARMQISPYRVQLAGVRTAPAEPRELSYEIVIAGVLTVAADSNKSETSQSTFEILAAISREDAPLLKRPRPATVWLAANHAAELNGVATLVDANTDHDSSKSGQVADIPRAQIRISSNNLTAGMQVRGVIRVPAADLLGSNPAGKSLDSSVGVLAVPESAVVDHGDRQLVFVESMPGTFDATVVTLGPRCGDYYPVASGLQPKQRIAVAGAFLIDAETRLNPSLSISYFGANQASAEKREPEVRVAAQTTHEKPSKLSPDEMALAEKQKTCPVTGLPLNSMGGPVVSIVNGRKVFLCCKGCEPKLKEAPAKYLAKLPAP